MMLSYANRALASGVLLCLLGFGPRAAQGGHALLSYEDYGAVLASKVNQQGMVNYRELKAKPERLLAFLQSRAKLEHQVYQQWEDKEKIAFWINAYNALTLKAIIDHYPIAGAWGNPRFPAP
jgi:hypothetical protein